MEQEKPNHRIKIVALRNRPGFVRPRGSMVQRQMGNSGG